ncbi:hypothetical protein [Sphingomonas sp.]|jgi:hypothetical protein|uniref:hypothetical protein n=1 Tax=Sphingomonas sp. TaxID=28214 RepID=UPI00356B3F98
MADMIAGLLGQLRRPEVSQGLLALGGSLMNAGAQGVPTGAGIGQGVQAFQQAQQQSVLWQQQQEAEARRKRLQEIQEKAISQITDADMRMIADIAGPEGLTQLLVAKQKAVIGTGTPSNVREWEYYNALTPAQQQQYLAMKRAAQFQDLGGSIAPVDARTAALNLDAATPKTLPPQDLPSVRGAQAGASTAASEAAKSEAGRNEKAPAYGSFQIAATNMLESIGRTPTGGFMGATGQLSRVTDYQKVRQFDNRKEQLSTELRTLFRIPGEGTLSDREQAQYGMQLPDVRNDPAVNRQIIADLESRIKERLGSAIEPAGPATQAPDFAAAARAELERRKAGVR